MSAARALDRAIGAGWSPPPWMRCAASCRLVLDVGADGAPIVLAFADGRLTAPGAAAGEVDEEASLATSEGFVAAWLTDPDTLLGDALGQVLDLSGQLFLVSLFDGLIGRRKAELAAG